LGKINSRLEGRKRKAVALNFIRIAAAVVIIIGFGGGLMQLLRLNIGVDNYQSDYKILTIPSPDIAGMPAPRQTPPHENGNEEKVLIREQDIEIPESLKSTDLRLTSLILAPVIREPELPGPASARPAAKIEYPDHTTGIIAPAKYPMTSYTLPGTLNSSKQGRWTAGILAAPGYAFRSLSAQGGRELNKAMFNNNESGIFAHSGRLIVSYMVNERLSLQTGIDLLKMGQNLENLYVVTEPSAIDQLRNNWPVSVPETMQPVQNSLGEITTTRSSMLVSNKLHYTSEQMFNDIQSDMNLSGSRDQGRIIQELYYLQAPVLLRYRIFNGNQGIVASGGMGASYLAGNSVLLKYHGENIDLGKTLNIRNFGLTGIAGLALEQRVSDKTILIIEPRLTWFITPVNSGAGHHLRPWSLSFYGGIAYTF
jgi:hypothetical protein